MPASRCTACSEPISLPYGTSACPLCGGPTESNMLWDRDEDWQARVAEVKMLAIQGETAEMRWRFGQLMEAGMPPRHAETLAKMSPLEVDLHQAVKLTKEAGPMLAFEILV